MRTREKQICNLVNNHIIGVDEIKEFQSTLKVLFDCFLNSKVADDTEVRKQTYYIHLNLSHFFEGLEQLTAE